VPSFGTRLVAASIEVDLSTIRVTASARRALVVAGALAAGFHLDLVQAGVSSAMAALLVGLLDKGPSPRQARRSMITSTALFTLITLAAGLTSDLPIVGFVLMALLAALAGIGFSINPRSTQVLVFAAVMAAGYSIKPITPDTALAAATGVLLAGLVQTVLVLATEPLIRDWPERRQVIFAMKSVRDLLTEVGRGVDTLDSARNSSRAMELAQRTLAASDLPSERLDQYWLILDDIDSMRLEARALAGRSRLGFPMSRERESRAALTAGAAVLQSAVTALMCRFTRAREECGTMRQHVAEVDAMTDPSNPPDSPDRHRSVTGTVATDCAHLAGVIEPLVSERSRHRVARPAAEPLIRRLRAALEPGSVARRHGLRLAGAAITGELIGRALGLSYSSWVAVTAMMILRPDVGPTIPRIITRALGATIGVGAVVIAFIPGWDSAPIMVGWVLLLAWCVFTFAPVNNALMTGLMTTLVISLLAIAGRDPQQVAAERLLDVVVGCVVGTGFALLVPVWTRDRLRAAVGAYCVAAAGYLRAIGQSTVGARPDPDREADVVRARGRQARAAGRAAEADLRTSLLEPGSLHVRPEQLSIVIAWVQRANEAGVVAEVSLRHDQPAGRRSTQLAELAAGALESTAAVVTAHPGDPAQVAVTPASWEPGSRSVAPDAFDNDSRDSNTVDMCLARAVRCARAAHRAAGRTNTRAHRA